MGHALFHHLVDTHVNVTRGDDLIAQVEPETSTSNPSIYQDEKVRTTPGPAWLILISEVNKDRIYTGVWLDEVVGQRSKRVCKLGVEVDDDGKECARGDLKAFPSDLP